MSLIYCLCHFFDKQKCCWRKQNTLLRYCPVQQHIFHRMEKAVPINTDLLLAQHFLKSQVKLIQVLLKKVFLFQGWCMGGFCPQVLLTCSMDQFWFKLVRKFTRLTTCSSYNSLYAFSIMKPTKSMKMSAMWHRVILLQGLPECLRLLFREIFR